MTRDERGREVFGGGGSVAVDVAGLERELVRLWKTRESEQEKDSDPALAKPPSLLRVCTRNLIVLGHGREEIERASQVVASAAARYPVRSFLVNRDPEAAPGHMEAHLSAQCVRHPSGRQVCCEQVSLTVGPQMNRRAAGVVIPLLTADLPTFLWTLGAVDPRDEFITRILDVADRWIVDSRSFEDPYRDWDGLLERRPGDSWALGDLEWSRLVPWREAVASLFDEPARMAGASRMEEVRVRYAGGPRRAAGAALLAAWIGDRLDEIRSGTEARSTPRFVLEGIEPGAPDCAPCDVLGVRLEAPGIETCLEVVREGADWLTTRVECSDSGPRAARRPGRNVSPPDLLCDQFEFRAARPAFESAMRRARTLLAETPEWKR